jgi:hypothetical protein
MSGRVAQIPTNNRRTRVGIGYEGGSTMGTRQAIYSPLRINSGARTIKPVFNSDTTWQLTRRRA